MILPGPNRLCTDRSGGNAHGPGRVSALDGTVYLPSDLKVALRRASRSTGRSEAELIREGIGLVTGAHRIAEPRLPLFESGEPDLAERADDLLAGFGER